MITLNKINGTDILCEKYERKCLDEFKGELIGVAMGIAYGGDVERIARIWDKRGKVYGFDTFEGHPKQLCPDPTDFQATCMDFWYYRYGMEKLTYEYQRKELDDQGLTNAILIKGLVNKDSCKNIPYLNYAFLDMDILASMEAGYEAVKNKIVKGGYLLLHDVYQNIAVLEKWYQEKVRPDWEVMDENYLTAVLRKR